MTNLTINEINNIRNDFPYLQRKINGKRIIYFDNGATSQRPIQVINEISDFYKSHNANIHRGVHRLSLEASNKYDKARKTVAKFINANEDEIIFVRNTTEAINIISHAFAPDILKPEDAIIISEMEHHSNLIPWQIVSEKTKSELKYIPVTAEGKLDISKAEELISKNSTKIVSVAHASNVLGTINDVKKITKMAHENGAFSIVDGAQSVPHIKVDVKDMNCDFLAFSGHKMLGPFGIGVLYGKKEMLEKIKPFLTGGGMISNVEKYKTTYTQIPERFEAGTPNVSGAIGLGAAVEYLNKIGMNRIEEHERELTRYMLEELDKLEDIFIYGPKEIENKVGVVSFNIKNKDRDDVGVYLSDKNIYVRTGHHCAQPLMKVLGVKGTIRASLYLYNTYEEIDHMIKAIKELI